ncbi:MAG: hypothetical protein ABIO49_04720 [Dokdonella sp.]
MIARALVGLDEKAHRALTDRFSRTLAGDARHSSRSAFEGSLPASSRDSSRAGRDWLRVDATRAILDELRLHQVELVASRVMPGRFGPRIAVRNIGREKLRQLALRGVH